MNFLTKIKSINLLQLSGISKIIFVEIYKGQIILSYIKVSNSIFSLPQNYNSLKTDVLVSLKKEYSDVFQLKSLLEQFIDSNNISTTKIIIGIDEFRIKNIPLSDDYDDIDEWLSENSSKFLPNGSISNDFTFSYEVKNKSVDESQFLLIAITRIGYVNAIIKSIKSLDLNILSIYPIGLASHIYASEGENLLYINLLQNKLYYTYTSKNTEITNGNIFGFEEVNCDKIDNSQFEKLYQNLPQDSSTPLSILIQDEQVKIDKLQDPIKNIFKGYDLKFVKSELETKHINTKSSVKKIFFDYDKTFNLTPQEYKDSKRDNLEKEIVSKSILLAGGFLIIFLLGLYLTETYMSEKLSESENKVIEIKSANDMLTKYEKENSFLNQNLELLTTLKIDHIKYSDVLKDIIYFVSEKSRLTEVKTMLTERNKLQIDLKGESISQSEVAEIMQRIEVKDIYKNINLIYANRGKRNNKGTSGKYINFHFRVDYVSD